MGPGIHGAVHGAREARGGNTGGHKLFITEPAQADGFIRDGQLDLVLLAHQELSDPNWPYHAAKALGVAAPQNTLPAALCALAQGAVSLLYQAFFF